jgi:eukaryotic-like serine/threonine-protein kinase
MTAKFGADHPETLTCTEYLATAYRRAGKPDLAAPLLEKKFRLMKALRGPDHPDTLVSMNNLASAHSDAGKPALAVPLLE